MSTNKKRYYAYPAVAICLVFFAFFVHIWLNRYAAQRMKLLAYVELGELEAVDYILEWDSDQLERRNSHMRVEVNREDPENDQLLFIPVEYTPLGMAIAGGHPKIVATLLRAGANPNASSVPVGPPLHIASKRGRLEIARQLLEHGADIRLRDAQGKSCLQHAVSGGNMPMVKFLIQQGAPVNVAGDREDMLLDAANHGFADLVRLLLDGGVDASCVSAEGNTPLHLAARSDHLAVAKLLVEKGAGLEVLRRGGMTPLLIAVNRNAERVSGYLLEKGAKPSLSDDEGWSPLHYAVTNNNIAIVKQLLNSGANVNARDSNGRKPLDYARGKAVKLLKDKGATKSKSSIDNLLDELDDD